MKKETEELKWYHCISHYKSGPKKNDPKDVYTKANSAKHARMITGTKNVMELSHEENPTWIAALEAKGEIAI